MRVVQLVRRTIVVRRRSRRGNVIEQPRPRRRRRIQAAASESGTDARRHALMSRSVDECPPACKRSRTMRVTRTTFGKFYHDSGIPEVVERFNA